MRVQNSSPAQNIGQTEGVSSRQSQLLMTHGQRSDSSVTSQNAEGYFTVFCTKIGEIFSAIFDFIKKLFCCSTGSNTGANNPATNNNTALPTTPPQTASQVQNQQYVQNFKAEVDRHLNESITRVTALLGVQDSTTQRQMLDGRVADLLKKIYALIDLGIREVPNFKDSFPIDYVYLTSMTKLSNIFMQYPAFKRFYEPEKLTPAEKNHPLAAIGAMIQMLVGEISRQNQNRQ
jgi:hypothetical protein